MDSKLKDGFQLLWFQTFGELVEKEGESFPFSRWYNESWEIRIQVAKHTHFLPARANINYLAK